MDNMQLLVMACVIFLLGRTSMSQETKCDKMKIYGQIQTCSSKYSIPFQEQPDMNNLAEFCKTLEAARLCTKMAIEKCDDEDVKMTVTPQLQQYDALTQSFCAGGSCTGPKMQECFTKMKQPNVMGMEEYCRSVKEVKDCLQRIITECEDKTMRKLVQDALKDIRKQKNNCNQSLRKTSTQATISTAENEITTTSPTNGVLMTSAPSHVAVITLSILYFVLCIMV